MVAIQSDRKKNAVPPGICGPAVCENMAASGECNFVGLVLIFRSIWIFTPRATSDGLENISTYVCKLCVYVCVYIDCVTTVV